MAPEEALQLQVRSEPDIAPSRYVGFAAMPDSPPRTVAEHPSVDSREYYSRALGGRTRPRRRNWEVMRNVVDQLLGWDSDRERCEGDPVQLPAVSADGGVLALGLSAEGPRGSDATVRIVSTETGALLARYRLPRVRAGVEMPIDEACEVVGDLTEWLAPGGFISMQGRDRTDSSFPDDVDPWIYVASDAARRERSGGNDVVVVPATAIDTHSFGVRTSPEGAPLEPTAFVSEHVAVFTEYYVGC